MFCLDVSVEKQLEAKVRRLAAARRQATNDTAAGAVVPAATASTTTACSLPRVPHFAPPIPMTTFLSEYCGFDGAAVNALPPTHDTAMWVYVLESSSIRSQPRRFPMISATTARQNSAQPALALSPSQMLALCEQPSCPLVQNFLAGSVFLRAVFAVVSAAAVKFLLHECALVVQFGGDGDVGGVRMLGRSLAEHVASYNCAVGLPRDAVKHGRFAFSSRSTSWKHLGDGAPQPHKHRRQPIEDVDPRRLKLIKQPPRSEEAVAAAASSAAAVDGSVTVTPSVPPFERVLLSPRLLVSHGGANSRMTVFMTDFAPAHSAATSGGSGGSSGSAPPPSCITWLTPFHCDVFRAMLQRQLGVASPLLVPAVANLFAHVWNRQPQQAAAATAPDALYLLRHSASALTQLLATVLHAAGRVNVRGAVLRVRARMEQPAFDATASATPLSLPLVQLFYRTLLEDLSRRVSRVLCASADEETKDGAATASSSSSDPDASTWLFGGEQNLARLLDALQRWLSCNWRGKGVKPTALLDGVQLGRIAWLTRVEQGATHRAARLQQTFSVFWAFVVAFVLPEWSRTSMHVTFSAKQSALLLFYLREDWNRWLRLCLQHDDGPFRLHERVSLLRSAQLASPLLQRTESESERDSELAPVSFRHHADRAFSRAVYLPPTSQNLCRTGLSSASNRRNPLLMYSAVRLLPDGSGGANAKLRPISIMRIASKSALRRLTLRIPVSVHQRRSGQTRAVTEVLHNSDGQRGRRANREPLHRALLCLQTGLREHRHLSIELGGGASSQLCHVDGAHMSSTPQNEYLRLLEFVQRLHNTAQQHKEQQQLFFVKADASRCFDSLDQELIRHLCRGLVTHSVYARESFEAVSPLSARAVASMTRKQQRDGSADAPPAFLLGRRHWQAVLTQTEWGAGAVPHVPQGWIVEPRTKAASQNDSKSSFQAASKQRMPHQQQQQQQQRQQQSHPTDALSGVEALSVLLHHTQNHFRVVRGRLYEQEQRGIAQGSAVASMLCDMCLSHVEREIAQLLVDSDDRRAQSLTLRRMDDVLVLTTSADAARAAAERVRRGWPDSVGFVCNAGKLLVHTSADDEAASDAQIPWCGLLLHVPRRASVDAAAAAACEPSKPLQCSVDWGRLHSYRAFAATCLTTIAGGEQSVMHAFFRALRSMRMRFASPALVCATLNSTARIRQNLLEFCTVAAETLCELLLLLGAGSVRPHPRIFFRARLAAAGLLRFHVTQQLGVHAAAAGSAVPADAAQMCKRAALEAFATVLTRRSRAEQSKTMRLAAAVMAKMAQKK